MIKRDSGLPHSTGRRPGATTHPHAQHPRPLALCIIACWWAVGVLLLGGCAPQEPEQTLNPTVNQVGHPGANPEHAQTSVQEERSGGLRAPAQTLTTPSPLQAFLDLSYIRVSLKTMHDRHYLNYFRLESPTPDLHPLLVPQVRKYVIESVQGGTLLDRFISAFQTRITDKELAQMNQWLSSPLGKEVTRLEMGKFTNPNFSQPTVKFESLPTQRQALLEQFVDTNNLVSISINVLRLTKTGILEGMQAGQPNPQKVIPPAVTENDLVFARFSLLDHYSTLFQALSQAELAQVVKISGNATYQKVTMAMNRALIMAFNVTAGNIGRIIAQAAPQIKAAEEKAAAQKAALARELAPETLPPLKKTA